MVLIYRAVPDLFFSNPTGAGFCQIWNDKSEIRPEPEFQIDCNFTNVMCKTLRTVSKSYYSSKLSNVWEKSTFQIRQNYPAPVGFLPEPDFCRIWKKCRIPAVVGVKIRYSPTYLFIS